MTKAGALRRSPSARKDRVLVTGGAGFLGANLVDRLAARGCQVILYDSLARPGVERNLAWLEDRHRGSITTVRADIRDEATLREVVLDATAVVHLAAQVAVTTSLDDPMHDFEVNAWGTLNLLELLREGGPKPLLYASTNKVYGKLHGAEALDAHATRYEPPAPHRHQGVDESTPLDLQSPYGCSKGAADQYVLDYARVFGLPTTVFRMSCLYGPHQFGTEDQGWVAHFLISTVEGRPITIYGDGRQVRDVLYVDDAVDAYLAVLDDPGRSAGRAFNLGGGPACAASLVEMLERIAAVSGRTPDVRYAGWRPGDQLWYVSDTRALERATGWRARTSIDHGLARLHAWVLAQRATARPSPPTVAARAEMPA
jgi:CDP-paratose 2-epimerase